MSGSSTVFATTFNGTLSGGGGGGGGILDPSLGGTGENNGSNTITVNAASIINQDVSTTATPSHAGLLLSNTTNQLTLGASTQRVTLSAPASASNVIVTLPNVATTVIGDDTTNTLTNKTWNGVLIGATYGGTGVNNGSNTITVNAASTINQDVSTTAAPSHTSLSLSNTTNQITLGASTQRVTLSAPASASNVTVTLPNVATTLIGDNTTNTLTNKTWNGVLIGATYGGTGVNNGSNTITVTANSTINQDVSTTGIPSWDSATLSSLSAQLKLGTGTSITTLSAFGAASNIVVSLPTITTNIIGDNTTDTLTNKTWNGALIGATYGGTGVNNGSNTLTLNNPTTLTTTGTTNVTLPTSGTLIAASTAPSFSTYSTTTDVITGSVSGSATLSLLSYKYMTDPATGMKILYLNATWTSHDIVGTINVNLTPLSLASNYRWPLTIGSASGIGINQTGSLHCYAVSTTAARFYVNVSGTDTVMSGTDMASTGTIILSGLLS